MRTIGYIPPKPQPIPATPEPPVNASAEPATDPEGAAEEPQPLPVVSLEQPPEKPAKKAAQSK